MNLNLQNHPMAPSASGNCPRRGGGGVRRVSNGIPNGRRHGLSLLEVILSIAILGGAMVMIGQLYHLGYRSALQARMRTEANILADSTMAELAAGVLPLESTGQMEFPDNPGWTYSVDLQPSFQMGLFLATVTVQKGEDSLVVPTSLSIVRFIPDPDYEPEEDEE